MRLDIARDGQALSSSSVPVQGAGSGFTFAPRIQAGLNSYSFRLYSVSGSSATLQGTWSDIVAGDVFIVSGQSNAAARQHFPSNPGNPSDTSNSSGADRSPWVRTFGSSTADPTTAGQDDTWQVADGDSYQVSGAVGQYALRLGRQEVNTYGIPVALLQGGHEGRPVTFFQRNDASPADPGTNYGRLLGRAQRAGVQGQVRGIFWYQGESDNNDVASQTSGFASLLDDWRTDYPGVEHVYAHQIRNGCLDAGRRTAELVRGARGAAAVRLPPGRHRPVHHRHRRAGSRQLPLLLRRMGTAISPTATSSPWPATTTAAAPRRAPLPTRSGRGSPRPTTPRSPSPCALPVTRWSPGAAP